MLERVQQRLDRKPDAMTLRRRTVEHVFGTLKHWMGSTHFLTKTLAHVSTEMSLHVLAYNLKRVMRILGMARNDEGDAAGRGLSLFVQFGLAIGVSAHLNRSPHDSCMLETICRLSREALLSAAVRQTAEHCVSTQPRPEADVQPV